MLKLFEGVLIAILMIIRYMPYFIIANILFIIIDIIIVRKYNKKSLVLRFLKGE